jgi:hypothetical protein
MATFDPQELLSKLRGTPVSIPSNQSVQGSQKSTSNFKVVVETAYQVN